jgi:hypothetical protein
VDLTSGTPSHKDPSGMFRDSAFQYPLSVCPLWAGQKSRSRRENRRTIFNRPRVAHLGAFGGSGFRISFEATGGPCDLEGRAFLANQPRLGRRSGSAVAEDSNRPSEMFVSTPIAGTPAHTARSFSSSPLCNPFAAKCNASCCLNLGVQSTMSPERSVTYVSGTDKGRNGRERGFEPPTPWFRNSSRR